MNDTSFATHVTNRSDIFIMFNEKIVVYTKEDLYNMQDNILNALVTHDMKLHFVSLEHDCSDEDNHGFLTNQLPYLKSILIPKTLLSEALQFARIVKNCTQRKIQFLCCVCGQSMI